MILLKAPVEILKNRASSPSWREYYDYYCLGAFSYANYAIGDKYNSKVYGGLAAISLAAATLGTLVLREENYKGRSPRHKKM